VSHPKYNVHLSYGLKFSADEAAAMRAFIAAAHITRQ